VSGNNNHWQRSFSLLVPLWFVLHASSCLLSFKMLSNFQARYRWGCKLHLTGIVAPESSLRCWGYSASLAARCFHSLPTVGIISGYFQLRSSVPFLITMAADPDWTPPNSVVSKGRGVAVGRLGRCHGGRLLLMGSVKQDVERSFCCCVYLDISLTSIKRMHREAETKSLVPLGSNCKSWSVFLCRGVESVQVSAKIQRDVGRE